MLSKAGEKECKSFLSMVKTVEVKAYTTDFIYSIMIIMAGFKKVDKLKVFLSALWRTPIGIRTPIVCRRTALV